MLGTTSVAAFSCQKLIKFLFVFMNNMSRTTIAGSFNTKLCRTCMYIGAVKRLFSTVKNNFEFLIKAKAKASRCVNQEEVRLSAKTK